jgi:hypothetical protein
VLYIKFHFCEYFLLRCIGFLIKGRQQTADGRRGSAQRAVFEGGGLSKNDGAAKKCRGEVRPVFYLAFLRGFWRRRRFGAGV